MLSAFRRLSKSAVGTVIMVLFLLAILASFAIADIGNVRSAGFGRNSDALATVGGEQITARDLDSAMRRVLNEARQRDPEASYATIAGQFGQVLDGLIDERALLAFAADHGFVLSKRLIDAEIADIPQTRGLDGKFSEQSYQAFLQGQQLTDADLRRLIGATLTQRLVLAPAAFSARVPIGVAREYASMLLELREGEVATIPTDAFRAGLNPTDGDLQSFYAQNSRRYIVPEQRVLRIARISPDTAPGATPTDAEIAAYYKANQATYAGSETRVISQAVVQDKKVADGIATRARAGGSFAAAAAPAGLAAADVEIGAQTRSQFSGLAGEQVAAAAFAAPKGAVVGPIRSDLGWHVIRVGDVKGASGKTLAQARGEIATLLAAGKRKDALTDLVTRIEDQIDDGASFAEAVGAAKLPVITTPPVNSAGTSRADPAYRLPAELAPALKAGFAMAANDDPEVITLAGDSGYALVAVDNVAEAAPAPFASVRDQLREDWIKRKASDRARAAGSAIAAALSRGTPFSEAVKAAGVPLPAPQKLTARRMQIGQAGPEAQAPLKMLFSLTKGKSRMVADPQGRAYFVVKTDKIVPGNALSSPTLIAQTQAAFGQTASDELAQQLLVAMKADQNVKRNEKAIAASRQRITGSGN